MKTILAVLLIVVLVGVGIWLWKGRSPGGTVTFAGEPLDLARIEHEYPLSIAQRESLTPERLKEYSQEQVDQIYGRLTAGPIPDGPYDGDLFLPRGTDSETRLGEILGGGLKARLAKIGVSKTEALV